jgi:hypothetical protein
MRSAPDLSNAAPTDGRGPPVRREAQPCQLKVPGRKHRMEIPSELFTGHTIVRPARLGSVMTASSGTTIHWPSRRTR